MCCEKHSPMDLNPAPPRPGASFSAFTLFPDDPPLKFALAPTRKYSPFAPKIVARVHPLSRGAWICERRWTKLPSPQLERKKPRDRAVRACKGARAGESTTHMAANSARDIDFRILATRFLNDGQVGKVGCGNPHPGVELRANLKSIFKSCQLFLVAFALELTRETIHLSLGCP